MGKESLAMIYSDNFILKIIFDIRGYISEKESGNRRVVDCQNDSVFVNGK
nr:hypothetical protein [uncultured Capnocytophaga sp.]